MQLSAIDKIILSPTFDLWLLLSLWTVGLIVCVGIIYPCVSTYNKWRTDFVVKMNYWEKLYSLGGTSGEGSIGALREWKWQVLEKSGADLNNVIDAGCGDLSFWEGRGCKQYFGIEQSETVFMENGITRPDMPCVCIDAAKLYNVDSPAPTVLCLDVLFHVMDGQDYISILKNLSRYSSDYIFIYTWWRNPFLNPHVFRLAVAAQVKRGNIWNAIAMFRSPECDTDGEYQKYRNFNNYHKYLENHERIAMLITPVDINPFGAMWIFRRKK